MRFPKPFGILCATALCASILPVRADDNPAQAAARAAVLQAMQQQDAAGTNTAPVATPPSAPVVVAPVIPVPAQPVVTQPVVAQPVTTIPAPAPVATMNPTAGSTDNTAQAAARAALLQKMQGQDATGINAPPSAPVVMAPATYAPVTTANPTPTPAATTVAAPSTPVYRPIIAPSLPISADQQARLQALDAKYNANQITPQDYFNQREAILNGQ